MDNQSNLQAWGLTILRVIVGVVFVMHGGQKFQMGFTNVAEFLGQAGIPVPNVTAIVLTLVEFLGGAALVVGAFTRWVALLFVIDMAVAIVLVRLEDGFFAPQGPEFELTLLAASLALALAGGGAASVDRKMAKKVVK
jgi:putative oxidoreductase